MERGGQVRAGFTPVYRRRFGAAAPPDAAPPTQVETSFTPAQLRQVSAWRVGALPVQTANL